MRLLAAFIFFTRLPFWKIANVPSVYFKRIVEWWPITGWLTGGVTTAVLWVSINLFPIEIAILLAFISRLLITGALHEDGLADFFDGFGGGTSRDKTLSIMKDSHIGTYGVISLILYFALLYSAFISIPVEMLFMIIIVADSWSKFCAAQLINILPYARNVEESKAKVVYDRMNVKGFLLSLVFGILPVLVFLELKFWIAMLAPLFIMFALGHIMNKKIKGYTGDCCGATFLLCELSFYICIVFILKFILRSI